MAANENDGILEILKTFDIEELTLAFCLSMLVGLLIGILIFIFLTWMSRRRSSVRITTHPDQQARANRSGNTHAQLSLYRTNGFNLSSDGADRAALNLHRQTSVDPNELLGRSPSFQASTFRPPKKKDGGETRDENQGALLDSSGSTSPTVADMNQSESFWLGKGSLRGFLPTLSPPPAYDSVIHVFQTHT
ncbi:myc target protein 1 homolog [Brachyhypopomus gauderio]|uniref:myc target protein 1 homolog n=1 Tax=Brachyhypopomus gauderio TaxID=698409 RepID=UPI0040418727